MKNLGSKTLETKRLILRKLTEKDAPAIYNNWASDEKVTKTLTWETHKNIGVTEKILKEWLTQYQQETTYRWGIQLKETNELIGMIDVVKNIINDERCEIGYCLMHKYWNQGIMTEALESVINFLLNDVNYYMIELCHASNNPASGKVMEKCGLKKDGQLPNRVKNIDGTRADLIYYSITKK